MIIRPTLNENAQINLAGIILFLILSIIIIPLLLNAPLESYFIIVLALALLFLSFFKTNLALSILIFSMLLSPELGLGNIPGRTVILRVEDIFIIIIFIGWLAKVSLNKEFGLLRSTPLNKPILIYVTICVLSTLLGMLQGDRKVNESTFYLMKYIEYFLIFFMVVNNIKDLRQVKVFIFLILLTCFLICVYAWKNIPSGVRLSAPFEGKEGEPNTLAGYLILMMGLILGFLAYARPLTKRFFFFVFLGFAAIPFLFTLSRGGWLAFFCMFITFIAVNKKFKLSLIFISISIMLLLPHVMPQRIYDRISSTFTPGKTYTVLGMDIPLEESAVARIESWKVGFELWLKKPILGYGVPSGIVIDNQYTRVLNETGIVGFIAFMWLLLRIFKMGLKTYHASESSEFASAVSLGFITGFMGIVTMSLSAAAFIIIRIMEPFWFLAGIVTILPLVTAPEYNK